MSRFQNQSNPSKQWVSDTMPRFSPVFLILAMAPSLLAQGAATTSKVTYTKDVEPILQKHCIGRRRPGKKSRAPGGGLVQDHAGP